MPYEYLISGLQYIPQYISTKEHNNFIEIIDENPWVTELKRRVQHYGYKYDYKKRAISTDMKLGELPNWMQEFVSKLKNDKLISSFPDQAIINEYYPGQGISQHVDCVTCFSETIISLTLNSSCIMEFINIESRERKILFLEPCALVVMNGEVRYEWQHRIPARKKDLYKGEEIPRGRRVSLTFRNVIL
jgi:alkylated DNA repair dioxygenase AlkB